MNEMGKRINQKRTEIGMTMEQLASYLGVKASAINKYEKGMVENIKRSTIKEMSVLFDCNPAWLMGFDAPESNISDVYTKEEKNLINLFRNAEDSYKEDVIDLLKKHQKKEDYSESLKEA